MFLRYESSATQYRSAVEEMLSSFADTKSIDEKNKIHSDVLPTPAVAKFLVNEVFIFLM